MPSSQLPQPRSRGLSVDPSAAGCRAGRTVSSAAHSRRPPGSERSVAGPQYENYDLQAHPARPALAVIPAPPRTAARSWPIAAGGAPAEEYALGAVGGVPAGESVVADNEIPYQPWALAQKKDNAAHWLERDPEIRCFMPGVPRNLHAVPVSDPSERRCRSHRVNSPDHPHDSFERGQEQSRTNMDGAVARALGGRDARRRRHRLQRPDMVRSRREFP